jgi:hypothetical protein
MYCREGAVVVDRSAETDVVRSKARSPTLLRDCALQSGWRHRSLRIGAAVSDFVDSMSGFRLQLDTIY